MSGHRIFTKTHNASSTWPDSLKDTQLRLCLHVSRYFGNRILLSSIIFITQKRSFVFVLRFRGISAYSQYFQNFHVTEGATDTKSCSFENIQTFPDNYFEVYYLISIEFNDSAIKLKA